MRQTLSTRGGLTLFVALALALALVPLAASAQTAAQDSLRATIRAAISADPRSQGMTQAQLDSLVNALSYKADRVGLTAEKITWRPYTSESIAAAPPQAVPSCWGFPDTFCALNSAIGFGTGDPWAPLVFFAAAAAFFVIVALMRRHGHPHAQFESNILA